MGEPQLRPRNAQRVVFIGAAGVGKTSIIARIVKGEYHESPAPTVSGQFSEYKTQSADHPVVDLWDTAGMEKYQALSVSFYRGAAAAVVVFDITNTDSFEGLDGMIQKFNDQTSGATVVVAGNKCDMRDERLVDEQDIMAYSQRTKYPYFEVSAKTGEGVSELLKGLLERMPPPRERSTETWNTPEPAEPNEKKCC